MKILELTNQEGEKRYYSGFYCEPYICCNVIRYFVRGQYYDSVRKFDVSDILFSSADMCVAMEKCLGYATKLSEQSDVEPEDPLFVVYFHQMETGA